MIKYVKQFKAILTYLISMGFYYIINSIWQLLEVNTYGQINPNGIDTIIALCFLPFVWYTSSKLLDKYIEIMNK